MFSDVGTQILSVITYRFGNLVVFSENFEFVGHFVLSYSCFSATICLLFIQISVERLSFVLNRVGYICITLYQEVKARLYDTMFAYNCCTGYFRFRSEIFGISNNSRLP